MALYKYPSTSRQTAPAPVGITEFEILKASHKFLRDEDERPTTWDDKLAGKYYSNLYREFAVCDLKHYKSGNFALRWRTEEEVLDGSGETTCGNTRCEHHFPSSSRFPFSKRDKDKEGNDTQTQTQLTTLELPFAYIEQGESKSALVKVVLCRRCVKKLMWKRTKEKEKERVGEKGSVQETRERNEDLDGDVRVKEEPRSDDEGFVKDAKRKKKRSREEEEGQRLGDEAEAEGRSSNRRRRRSRSRSPLRRSREGSRAR